MLLVLRLLGLLAPVALALRFIVIPELERALAIELVPENVLSTALSGLVGAGVACLLASLWIGFRLGSLGRAAERIAAGEYEARLKIPGSGVERQLAVAFNRVAESLSEKHDAATTDKLTQIANRAAILPALFTEVERVSRYGRPLAVAFADIDHFKSVNDFHGHEAGDRVLRRVASVLRDNVRATDTVARYGGEEFMLLLTETTVEEAAVLAEKLRLLVMGEQIQLEGGQAISVTISIGVTGGVGSQVRFDSIVRDADAAMYTAKSLGRNQVYTLAEDDDDARVRRAPVSAEGHATAMRIGRSARLAAERTLLDLVDELRPSGSRNEAITETAIALGRSLRLPETEIERIRVASLLHDVGAVAVPAEVLEKREALSPEEWHRIIQHPRVGQLILEQASALRDVIPIVLHHHERFAGHGYPHGLRGHEIPMGARILAVSDAYHAMLRDRPYRPALDHATAITELQRHAGTQFDPDVVAAFRALYEHEPLLASVTRPARAQTLVEPTTATDPAPGSEPALEPLAPPEAAPAPEPA
ncbi:MAG TPA: diguanylate cyclase [Candidatus Limnocylindrales bacterium]|nr:diguanylate cyclase [Candidatus Limnocylindrales bacterium]